MKISYFLFFSYVTILQSTITWKENLPHFSKSFILSFLPLPLPTLVHVGPQHDNEVSTWFP